MYFSLLVYLALAISYVHAISLPQVAKKSSAPVISMDVELEQPDLLKRGTEAADFGIVIGRYMVNFYLGSSHQKIRALLDTSSFALNIYRNQFDISRLRTVKDLDSPFETIYIDNRITGKRYQDRLMIPGVSSVDIEFGIIDSNGVDTETPFGLAIGKDKTQSLVWLLKKAKKIGKLQYSLYVDHATRKGKIIFGGIDKSKYSGTLIRNPMTLPIGSIRLVNIRIGNKKNTLNRNVIIDSGSSFGLLDPVTYNWFARIFKLRDISQIRDVIDCNQPANKFVSFKLLNNVISIPYKNFAVPGAQNLCYFPFTKADRIVLGSWFMKDLYISFDYSDNTLAMAPYKPSRTLDIVPA